MRSHNESFSKTHLPCPCKESSDAYAIRTDGSGYCFSCGENYPVGSREKNEDDIHTEEQVIETKLIPFRGISQKTVNKHKLIIV